MVEKDAKNAYQTDRVTQGSISRPLADHRIKNNMLILFIYTRAESE